MGTRKPTVSIYRCSKCGHEDYTLTGRKPRPECPRCGSQFMPVRQLSRAPGAVIRKAEHEDSVR